MAGDDKVRLLASVISRFDYRYDDAGNRIGVTEDTGDRVTWTYDDTHQLLAEHRSGANAYATTFAYDPVGNRLVKQHDGARTTSVYDAANQYIKGQPMINAQPEQEANGGRSLGTRLRAMPVPVTRCCVT